MTPDGETNLSDLPQPASQRDLTIRYVQLALSCLAAAAAQLLLKRGASDGPSEAWHWHSVLFSGWGQLGIVAHVASLVWWLSALRSIPLGVASNLSGAIHVLVPMGCWLLLGESISSKRWIGISLVVAGVLISAKPASAVEEKVEDRL